MRMECYIDTHIHTYNTLNSWENSPRKTESAIAAINDASIEEIGQLYFLFNAIVNSVPEI